MEKKEVAEKILAYLERHRDAQDTLQGIIQWWLMEQEIHFQIGLVEEAVEYLVRQELLVEIESLGTNSRYRIKNFRV